MLEKGNGEINVCVTNLVRTVRHTVPYERFKGININVIDKPITEDYQLQVAVDSVIADYEPRVSSRDVDVIANDPKHGGVIVEINTA